MLGFIIDTIIYNINIIKLDERSDKLVGFILGTLKSFLIITLLIYSSQLIPLQKDIKINIHNKMKKSSLFIFCENIKIFILNDNK